MASFVVSRTLRDAAEFTSRNFVKAAGWNIWLLGLLVIHTGLYAYIFAGVRVGATPPTSFVFLFPVLAVLYLVVGVAGYIMPITAALRLAILDEDTRRHFFHVRFGEWEWNTLAALLIYFMGVQFAVVPFVLVGFTVLATMLVTAQFSIAVLGATVFLVTTAFFFAVLRGGMLVPMAAIGLGVSLSRAWRLATDNKLRFLQLAALFAIPTTALVCAAAAMVLPPFLTQDPELINRWFGWTSVLAIATNFATILIVFPFAVGVAGSISRQLGGPVPATAAE